LSRNFFRSLEKATYVDVEAQVCEATRNDFCTSVVTVLAHFGDEDPRVPTLGLREVLNVLKGLLVLDLALFARFLSGLFAISSSNDGVLGNMAAIDLLQGVANFANCCSEFGSLHR
jgi:hypothetical protein